MHLDINQTFFILCLGRGMHFAEVPLVVHCNR